ncbi:MAG: polyamine aminopropyltransferase [Planctomycetes bacterium]|nr:polyamine aminopropyltransferase [Planctomycetota bacterium]
MNEPADQVLPRHRGTAFVLLLSIFVVATCGLVYELVAGTLSSYLLGDSVTQFSIVIGLFLTAMGLGSWLSRCCVRNLAAWFVGVEIGVGIFGGTVALVGFSTFALTELFLPILVAQVVVIGTLVGLEIPLVIRLLRELETLRVTVARVLSVDYVGAFAASIVFPFVLLPHMGLVRAALLAGLTNVLVGLVLLHWLRDVIGRAVRPMAWLGGAAAVVLVVLSVTAGGLTDWMEDRIYQDEIIFARNSAVQRVIVTRWKDDFRLYLNGHLQFSSVDEYRYHEALVMPVMAAASRRDRVLVLGGGDGMVVREVLRHPGVQSVDLVDLDPMVTNLFRDHALLARLNDHSLVDPRVSIHNQDARKFLEGTHDAWDVVIMDLPDPSEASLGKLYAKSFFSLVGKHLAEGGAMSSQATSPFRAREAFWCIVHSAEAARWGLEDRMRLSVRAYHTVVPTFGTWGFLVATTRPVDVAGLKPLVTGRYLNAELWPTLFRFPTDMAEVATPVSDLDDPVVCRLYRDGYHEYLE